MDEAGGDIKAYSGALTAGAVRNAGLGEWVAVAPSAGVVHRALGELLVGAINAAAIRSAPDGVTLTEILQNPPLIEGCETIYSRSLSETLKNVDREITTPLVVEYVADSAGTSFHDFVAGTPLARWDVHVCGIVHDSADPCPGQGP